MELVSGTTKYRPTWTNPCGGDDVKGHMELDTGKYKPVSDAYGICDEKSGIMVNSEGKYHPRIVLDYEDICCPGSDCSVCDDILWDSGETPKRVKVVISGVTEAVCSEGNDPNNTYILEQVPDWPCWWYYDTDANGFFLYYTASGYDVANVVLGTATYWYFIGVTQPPCSNETFIGAYSSDVCCGPGGYAPFGIGPKYLAGYGGQAVVSWPA